MAEFDIPTDLVDAARRTTDAGYRKIDAYSPFPVEELAEAIGFHNNGVPLVVLIGGMLGASPATACSTGLPPSVIPSTSAAGLTLMAGVHRGDI